MDTRVSNSPTETRVDSHQLHFWGLNIPLLQFQEHIAKTLRNTKRKKNTPSTPIKTPLEAPWPIAPVAGHGVTNVPGGVLVSRQGRHWHVHCILHHQKFGHVTSNTNRLRSIFGNLWDLEIHRKFLQCEETRYRTSSSNCQHNQLSGLHSTLSTSQHLQQFYPKMPTLLFFKHILGAESSACVFCLLFFW